MMRNRDTKGLIVLLLVVIVLAAGGWMLMRGSKFAMREKASPSTQDRAASHPDPTTGATPQ